MCVCVRMCWDESAGMIPRERSVCVCVCLCLCARTRTGGKEEGAPAGVCSDQPVPQLVLVLTMALGPVACAHFTDKPGFGQGFSPCPQDGWSAKEASSGP